MEAVRLTVVAGRFLTRLPLPDVEIGHDDLRRSTAAFPLVGLVVAGLAAAVLLAAEPLVGTAAAAVLAVTTGVMVTGAFHEDGLADVADGFWGGYDPARRLEIMRDSRVGTFGASALALSLLLRVALLGQLTPGDAVRALVVGHVLGRASILLAVHLAPTADPSSTGALVARPLGVWGSLVGAVLAVGPVVVASGVWAWIPLLLGAVTTLAMARLAARKVGGITGDVLGATNQVVHVAAMAAVAALVRAGHL